MYYAYVLHGYKRSIRSVTVWILLLIWSYILKLSIIVYPDIIFCSNNHYFHLILIYLYVLVFQCFCHIAAFTVNPLILKLGCTLGVNVHLHFFHMPFLSRPSTKRFELSAVPFNTICGCKFP